MLGLFTPGHRLLGLLQGQEVASLDVDHLHEHLADLRRVSSVVAGMQHVAMAALARRQGFGAAEVAASALDETTTTAQRLMVTSSRLVQAHPATMAGLATGAVGPRHATVLAEVCAALPVEVAQEIDVRVWDRVGEAADPTVLRREARKLALALDVEAAARTVRANRDKRRVEVWDGPEGTSWLGILMATEDALAARDSLRVRTAGKGEDEPRTRSQRMADLAVEDLTGAPPLLVADGRWVGPKPDSTTSTTTSTSPSPSTSPRRSADGAGPGPGGSPTAPGKKVRDRRVEIGVLIPLDVLAGLREGHATIDGQPVPASVARGLFQSDAAVMRRMLCDPITGHLLDLSPQTYRPGAQLKRFIKARDQQCWWSGCHCRARVCDEDHKTPFPAGSTTRINLGDLCERHHQLKHSGQWQVHVRDDGTIDLTGPHGTTVHVPHPRLHDDTTTWDPPPEPEPDPPPASEPASAPRPAPEPPPVTDTEDPPPF